MNKAESVKITVVRRLIRPTPRLHARPLPSSIRFSICEMDWL